MKVVGIIAEYNPFHNGHAYHIQKSKEELGADYCIVAMSGSFVQRGAPALLDKFDRARCALECGADMVLEIPPIYSVSSAEFFAEGSIALLDSLNVVTHLSFGSECGKLELLDRVAMILNEEPEEFSRLLKYNLKQGMSFPLARNQALLQYAPELCDASDLLSAPNNVLAVEYLKAIRNQHASMTPFTLLRDGSNYHEKYLGKNVNTSSLAIRHAVSYGGNLEALKTFLPEISYEILMKAIVSGDIIESNDFSEILLYKLLQEAPEGYSRYLDVNRELSDRIKNLVPQFTSFDQFCDLLKTKDRTYTRISRSLFHILLDIRDQDMESCRMLHYAPYAKVLGFRKEAEPLLTQIKSASNIPMVMSYTEAQEKLFAEPMRLFRMSARINNTYLAARCVKCKQPMDPFFRKPMLVVE